MKSLLLKNKIKYDGTQLRSLYGYLEHKILGDSIVAFRGACDVSFDEMVDGEDLLAKSAIRGSDMVHFIIEHFGMGLPEAVGRQRLFASIVKDAVEAVSDEKFVREGDDLFWKKGKFSISIATVSPVSALIHFAFNVSNKGTPVETSSLEDFKLVGDWEKIAQKVVSSYVSEDASIREAACKVRWVK